MVKANCTSFKRGKKHGPHLLESRHSLPLQNLGIQITQQVQSAKKCSSLTIPRVTTLRSTNDYRPNVSESTSINMKPKIPAPTENPSIQTFLVSEEQHSRVGLIQLPSARESEKEVSLPPTVSVSKQTKQGPNRKLLGDISKKQRELSTLQAKLIKQQNEYIMLYAEVRELQASTGKDLSGSAGDMRVVSVKGWPAHDLLMLVREDANVHNNAEVNGVIGPEVLRGLNFQLSTIPAEFLTMCNELIEQRSKILDFFREKRTERNYYNSVEWKKKNAEFDADKKRLHSLVTARANHIKAKIMHCLQIAKISWTDRESLLHQLECYQHMIYEREPPPEDTGKLDKLTAENKKLTEELNRERKARAALADVAASADGMISTARVRSAGFERQLIATRAELAAAKQEIINLRQYHARRESNLYARIKKIENDCKARDETVALLNRQRDALEIRVRELHEQTSVIMRNADMSETQLKSHIESLKMQLEEQERQRKTVEAQIMSMEKRLKDSQDQYKILQERSTELIALQRKNCLDFLPKKEIHPTEKEIEIWNDLQATREALDRVRVELERSRADKDGLLESLAKIAHEGPENRLAEELVFKEQTISRMRKIIEEKKEHERTMEQSVSRYEDQLAGLRLEIEMLRKHPISDDKSPGKKLEEEVLTLCRRVETLNRERAALVSAVASRALMLERHERCAELFAQVTRARRELAAQIDGRRAACEGPSSIKISMPVSSASADFSWPSLQPERGRLQPLTPLPESPALEQLIQKRTAQLEQEINERCKQESEAHNTNDETQLYLLH